jgi:glycosyltransferase involved in cell wall biosynthesis
VIIILFKTMTKQYRLFVDCHFFDGSFQGTTTYLKGLYSEFILDKNIQFFLASNDSISLGKIFGHHENVTYIQYKYSNKFLRLLLDIPSIIKKNKIDFAHFQYIVPPIKYCKYIVTIHDILFIDYPKFFPFSYRFRNKFLFKWSSEHSDIVLSVSEYSKKQIQRYFKTKDVIVTPNAVDPIYFESYSKEFVKNKILQQYGFEDYWIYVSRWEPRKNHLSLLRVFVENAYYNYYYLVFIGDDAIESKMYNEYFEELSEEIKSKVIRLKKVPFEDLVKLIRGANISVYPSFAEGFGIPPIEALAANVPSICSNTTAMSDFDFMNNMMFQPNNLNEIRICVDNNINTMVKPQVVDEMKKRYNWKSSVDKLKTAINFE